MAKSSTISSANAGRFIPIIAADATNELERSVRLDEVDSAWSVTTEVDDTHDEEGGATENAEMVGTMRRMELKNFIIDLIGCLNVEEGTKPLQWELVYGVGVIYLLSNRHHVAWVIF